MADPSVDKCACGRWKTAKSPRCGHCHSGRVGRTNPLRWRVFGDPRKHSGGGGGRPRKYPAAHYTKAADMRAQGISWKAIGDYLDLDAKAIKTIQFTVYSRARRAPKARDG